MFMSGIIILATPRSFPRTSMTEHMIWMDALLQVKTTDWKTILIYVMNTIENEPNKCEYLQSSARIYKG